MDQIRKLASLRTLLNKKNVFFALSFLIPVFLFVLAEQITSERTLYSIILVLSSVTLLQLILTLLIKSFNPMYVYMSLLPLHLVAGFLLTNFYFPNLGILVQALSFLGLVVISYVLFLVNNIFIVVDERGSVIPLFSAALAWVQILTVTISIPFYTGIFKIPLTFLHQNFSVFVSSFLFNLYMIWCLSYDPESRNLNIREKVGLSLGLSLQQLVFGLATAFFPSEAFLRGMFMATVTLYNLIYIQSHFKNTITKKLLANYGFISFIFFILLVLFRP